MSEKDANQLLQEGQAALAVGDKRYGSDLLKQAVAANPDLLAAWVALAPLLEDKEEKHQALTTILRLDPGNEYAQTELLATDKTAITGNLPDEIVPGITRREARLVGIGLTVFTLVVCLVVFLITSTINGQRAATANQVAQALANETATQNTAFTNATATAAELTEEATVMAATLFAQSSPTFTASPTRSRELPTPIPATATPTTVVLRAFSEAPNYLAGRIFAWGGRNSSSDDFLDLRIYPAGGNGTFTDFSNELARFPTTDNNGNRVIYMKYRRQNEWGLASLDAMLADSEATPLTLRLPDGGAIISPLSPSLTVDGTKLVFVALNTQTNRNLVYLMELSTNLVTLLTPPDADYLSVAIAPDGSKVVAVRNDGSATDLVLIDALDAANNYPRTPLTTDGNVVVEETVDMAVDGTTIVFAGTAANNTDLYVLRLSGTSVAGIEKLTTATAANREIHPSFSPDGRYIAYAANPTGSTELNPDGVMNLFIFEIGTSTTYQLTAGEEPVFPGGWSN